jgi:hypothetical protein
MEACQKYYDLFELSPDATIDEIRKHYSYLKSLYSGDAIEIAALNTDYTQNLQQDYLSRLDDAYEQLQQALENKKPAVAKQVAVIDDGLRDWIKSITCFTGDTLRAIRVRMGIELHDIFTVSRIQPHYLEDIENEQFSSFRAEVFLRSYLIEYTRFLSLDTQKVLADYLPRYRKCQGSLEKPV